MGIDFVGLLDAMCRSCAERQADASHSAIAEGSVRSFGTARSGVSRPQDWKLPW